LAVGQRSPGACHEKETERDRVTSWIAWNNGTPSDFPVSFSLRGEKPWGRGVNEEKLAGDHSLALE